MFDYTWCYSRVPDQPYRFVPALEPTALTMEYDDLVPKGADGFHRRDVRYIKISPRQIISDIGRDRGELVWFERRLAACFDLDRRLDVATRVLRDGGISDQPGLTLAIGVIRFDPEPVGSGARFLDGRRAYI